MKSNGIFAGITVGIQLNSTTAVSESGYATLSSNDPTPQDNIFFEFCPNPQPSFDMAGKSSTVYHTYALSSAPFNITGTLQNRGAATVTSYDLNYKVGAGITVTSNISGVNVATGAITNFSHPINWNPTAIGTYTIEAWASNINGNPDANTADDKVIFNVEIVDTIIPRKSLLEAFTSSTGPPDFFANKHLDTVVVPALSAGTYTIIKYQQNFPGIGDPYSTAKSVARRTFSGVNAVPTMAIDGQWGQNMSAITKPIIESFQTEPSFVSIDILSSSITGNTVSINADIKPWANLSGNLKYHVVITEKKTTQNATTNGQTEFFHVMMDMLPNENGSSLTSLTKGVVTNINMVSTFDTTNVEEFNDLKVVIFVQDSLSKKVLQSEWMDIPSSTYGTDSITACDSYTWINGITYSASNNSATDTLLNAAAGDSVVTLNLTIINSNTRTDVQTACNSYTWIDGITYTSSNNTATDTLTNAAGCDSVVTLNLTITNSSSATDVVSSCNSYTWIDGITYTASNNTATDTLTNAAGCDSVVTLNLTITNSPLIFQPINQTVNIGNNAQFQFLTSVTLLNYQWQMDVGTGYVNLSNAGQFSGADTNLLTVSNVNMANNNTNFRCIITESSTCKDTTNSVKLFVSSGTSIIEQTNSLVNLYPNPTSDFVTINLANKSKGQVIVLDLLGKVVLNKEFNSNQIQLSLKSIESKGTYLVKIIDSNGNVIANKKLIYK